MTPKDRYWLKGYKRGVADCLEIIGRSSLDLDPKNRFRMKMKKLILHHNGMEDKRQLWEV